MFRFTKLKICRLIHFFYKERAVRLFYFKIKTIREFVPVKSDMLVKIDHNCRADDCFCINCFPGLNNQVIIFDICITVAETGTTVIADNAINININNRANKSLRIYSLYIRFDAIHMDEKVFKFWSFST